MTKKAAFEAIIDMATEKGATEIVQFAVHEIAMLDNKNLRARTRANEKTAELAQKVLDILYMAENPMRTMEIAIMIGMSPQKITPVLKRLVAKNVITRGIGAKNTVVYAIVPKTAAEAGEENVKEDVDVETEDVEDVTG